MIIIHIILYAIILIVNRIYGVLSIFLLLTSIVLLFFFMLSVNQLESTVEELRYSNDINLERIENLIKENQILSDEISSLTLLYDNDLITQANLTITQTFQNNIVQINGKSFSVVNGSITNFGLQNANDVEVEVTWWILSDCGCDALPIRTELVKIDSIPSSSVYNFEKSFPFTFEKFEYLVININWK